MEARKSKKLYNDYYSRVEAYLIGSGIELLVSEDYENCYQNKKIWLYDYSEHSNWKKLATLLHEAGHAMDEFMNPALFHSKVDKTLRKTKRTSEETRIELECEIRAWFYAEGIARLLGIELGQWFYSRKNQCLATYYSYAAQVLEK